MVLVAALGFTLSNCRAKASNPYESATAESIARWKKIRIPLTRGTRFVVSQGAFGKGSHSEKGIEYRWDFDVPYGTPVVTVEDGTVIAVREPRQGGGATRSSPQCRTASS